MIAMQYKVILPKDYDMGIIRKRVKDNSHKTDGFDGLHFKAYLITEAEKNGNIYNSYAPLYVWDTSDGMNNFIYNGFYDNILDSFGWQHINIGVPLSIKLYKDFYKSSFMAEYEGIISEKKSLMNPSFKSTYDYLAKRDEVNSVGDLLVYNPDKWGYSHFSFHNLKPAIESINSITIYEILHVSHLY